MLLDYFASIIARKVARRLQSDLETINQRLLIMPTEQELADQLTAAVSGLKTEISATADRVIAALAALPASGDVSPSLQSAIDEIAADVATLKTIAAPPVP